MITKQLSPKKPQEVMLILCLVFGPIYWLPGLSIESVKYVKTFFVLSFLTLTVLVGNFRYHTGLIWVSYLLVISSGIISILKNDLFILEVSTLCAILHIFYSIGASDHTARILESIKKSIILFTIFPLIVIIDALTGGNIPNPFYDFHYPLFLSGFNSGRTGWAFICNIYVGIIFHFLLTTNNWKKYLYLAAIFIYGINIFIVGARGGVLTFLFLLTIFTSQSIKKSVTSSLINIIFIIGLILIIAILNYESIQESRVYQFLTMQHDDSSDITTGRSGGYSYALDTISINPFFGKGEINLTEALGYDYEKIHNVWLRIFAERGLIFFLIISLSIFYLTYSSIKAARYFKFHSDYAIFAGLFATLFEPTAILGNFFSTSMFWLLVCYFIGLKTAHQKLH